MSDTPGCPCCGAVMELVHYRQAYWYCCRACRVDMQAAGSPEDAHGKALDGKIAHV